MDGSDLYDNGKTLDWKERKKIEFKESAKISKEKFNFLLGHVIFNSKISNINTQILAPTHRMIE